MGEIVQAKARFNQSPDAPYLAVIKSWAEKQNLLFVHV